MINSLCGLTFFPFKRFAAMGASADCSQSSTQSVAGHRAILSSVGICVGFDDLEVLAAMGTDTIFSFATMLRVAFRRATKLPVSFGLECFIANRAGFLLSFPRCVIAFDRAILSYTSLVLPSGYTKLFAAVLALTDDMISSRFRNAKARTVPSAMLASSESLAAVFADAIIGHIDSNKYVPQRPKPSLLSKQCGDLAGRVETIPDMKLGNKKDNSTALLRQIHYTTEGAKAA